MGEQPLYAIHTTARTRPGDEFDQKRLSIGLRDGAGTFWFRLDEESEAEPKKFLEVFYNTVNYSTIAYLLGTRSVARVVGGGAPKSELRH